MINPSKPENRPSNPSPDLAPPNRPKPPELAFHAVRAAFHRAAGAGSAVGAVDPVSGRWPYGGLALLPFTVERSASQPASDASWAWSMRRLARIAVWSVPGYAIVYGLVTLVGSGSAPFITQPRPAHLLGWIGALWLGLLGLMALASLLVAARSRVTAIAGLLVATAGTMLLLPFGGLPDASAALGTAGQVIAVNGGVLYSLGWWLTGLALFRSGVFSQADGVLLMIAAPLLGIGGLLVAALHGLGAMLVLTAGIGVAWRAGRLLPPVGRAALTRPGAAGAVAASVPAGAGLGIPATGAGLGAATTGPAAS